MILQVGVGGLGLGSTNLGTSASAGVSSFNSAGGSSAALPPETVMTSDVQIAQKKLPEAARETTHHPFFPKNSRLFDLLQQIIAAFFKKS